MRASTLRRTIKSAKIASCSSTRSTILRQPDSVFHRKAEAHARIDGTLLDHSLVIYGSPMGNPNVHNHKRCPLFLAGHASGKLKGNLHLITPDGTPMANAMLSMLHMLGLDDVKSLGDRKARSI